MRMSAGDEVDAIHLRSNLAVPYGAIPGVCVISQMRHANHNRTTFALAQNFHYVARRFDRIIIFHTFEIFRRDQIVGAYAQAKEPDAHATNHAYNVRPYAALE